MAVSVFAADESPRGSDSSWQYVHFLPSRRSGHASGDFVDIFRSEGMLPGTWVVIPCESFVAKLHFYSV